MTSGIPFPTAPSTANPNRHVRLAVISLACVLGAVILCVATGLAGYTLGHRASRTQQSVASTPATVTALPQQESDRALEQDGPVAQLRRFVNKHGALAEQQVAAHVTRIHGLESLDDDFPRVKVFTDYAAQAGDDYEALTAHDNDVALLASIFATWHNQASEVWLTVYASDGTMLGVESF